MWWPYRLPCPYRQSFPDLFIESDRDRIRVLAEEAFSQHRILACEETFRTITPETSVSICLMAMGDKLLVHGLDTAVLSPEFPVAILQELVHRFMKVVHLSDKELFTESDQMVRSQFEQIQKLNNNLVNLQRQLQKTNQQLNRANQDLNNRLVMDALTGLISRYQYREEIEKLIRTDPESQGQLKSRAEEPDWNLPPLSVLCRHGSLWPGH